ncbi:hypothetical protein [Lentzea sp. NPDC092896]|uniref:hypothetical protein n=1 Tax=Lentzea sp. NPDC092896 TaxID=3364127 RepID=UPI00382A41A2
MAKEPTAYRASDELAAAYRQYLVDCHAQHEKANAYNRANPELPLYIWQSRYDHGITVCGFVDKPSQAVPPGLSRKQDRPYFIPRRGITGDGWRKVIAEYDRYPSLQEMVLRPHGLAVCLRVDFNLHVAGIFDFGEPGVFVRIGTPYPEPGNHLTVVPLSEFYRAKESFEGAKAVAS